MPDKLCSANIDCDGYAMAKEERLLVICNPRERTLEVPPATMLSDEGTRYLCGYCGVILVAAEIVSHGVV